MADGAQEGDKSGVVAVPPTVNQSEGSGKPPVTENVTPNGQPKGNVPYDRFQEVIQQKNEYATKIKELESRLQVQEEAIGGRAKSEASNKHIKRLVAAGMDDAAAHLLVETFGGLADEKIGARVQPLEQQSLVQQSQMWLDEFAKTHKDYDAVKDEMHKAYLALPENTKTMIASDPKGIELLYSYVKVSQMPEEVKKAEENGRDSAYSNKALKQAMSPTPGASATLPTGITRETVKSLSLSDYAKHRKEIFEALVRK